MAKQRTEKSRFPSRFAEGTYVSGPQYVTELFIEIYYRQSHKDLPPKFWELPELSRLYRSQIPAAVKLTRDYPTEVVIRTLRDKRVNWRIKSLRATWLLEPILKEKLAEYNGEQERLKNAPTIEKGDTLSQPQVIKGKEGIVSKLRALE